MNKFWLIKYFIFSTCELLVRVQLVSLNIHIVCFYVRERYTCIMVVAMVIMSYEVDGRFDKLTSGKRT
jgi:hypothetical protein